MQAKEILEKLRLTFNELVGQPTPVALIDATLADGTAVKITELAVGGIVTINDQPATAGEYVLSDGTNIVIGDNGAIIEIESSSVEQTEPATPEDMGAKFSAFESVTNEKFAQYESKFASYETRFADYESKLSKATTIIEGLISLTKQLSEAPTGAVDPAANVVNNFKEEKQEVSYDILFS